MMMTVCRRVLFATDAPQCTRAVRRRSVFANDSHACSQRRLQKVGRDCCAKKYANQELLRWIAQPSSSKSPQSPQRAMTFLKQLFWRDIFVGPHCHTKIHRADSSGWDRADCAVSCCAQSCNRERHKRRCKNSLRAHGAYDFLSFVRGAHDLGKRSRARRAKADRDRGANVQKVAACASSDDSSRR